MFNEKLINQKSMILILNLKFLLTRSYFIYIRNQIEILLFYTILIDENNLENIFFLYESAIFKEN